MNILNFLAGKKTYLVALAVAGLQFSVNVGWVSPDFYNNALGFLVASGLATLRAGVSKSGPVS